MIFKFLVSVTHSFILRGWTIFQVLMDTFIKKIENGTVLPIIPPSSGIRKENKNVYLHSDQVFGDAETLSLYIYQDSH